MKYSLTKILKNYGEHAIFRYVTFNQNSLQVLINRKLYFGNPQYQNDLIDSNYKLDISQYISNNHNFDRKNDSEKEHILRFRIDQIIKKDYGICCFSKKHKGILLWAHYTDGAQGFCLVFDKNVLYTCLKQNNNSMIIDNVHYDHLPIIDPKIIDEKFDFNINSIIYNKLPNWKYESEVRILCKLSKNVFNNGIHMYRFDPSALICILIGERMQNENLTTLKNIIKIPGYEHVELFKMKRNENKPNLLNFNYIEK